MFFAHGLRFVFINCAFCLVDRCSSRFDNLNNNDNDDEKGYQNNISSEIMQHTWRTRVVLKIMMMKRD